MRGQIYRLGRLQFNVEAVRWDPAPGDGFSTGDPLLGVHIPPGSPLTPAACDESFARARPFFDRHVPGGPYRIASCGSWLLDPQLAGMLGADSNIVRFQRRFARVPGQEWPGDEDVLRFVFGQPEGRPGRASTPARRWSGRSSTTWAPVATSAPASAGYASPDRPAPSLAASRRRRRG